MADGVVRVLYKVGGDPVIFADAVAEGADLDSAAIGFPVMGKDAIEDAKFLRVDTTGQLMVVLPTADTPGFYAVKAGGAATPAKLTSTGTAPFAIGGEVLNIDINGVPDSCTFSTIPATAGTSTSDHDPATSNATKNKLWIRIDAGEWYEIEIAKSLVGGSTIAAAIEDAIQGYVENGGSATCDYNDSAPGKYRVTSGSTGTGSWVEIDDSGKGNMAAVLKLGVPNGGLEVTGTAGADHSAYDAVDELNDQLGGVIAYVADGDVVIETTATGTSATLEVTGGAANTDLGFPTSEVTGTAAGASVNMAVDGSSSTKYFSIPLHASKTFTVTRLIYVVRDAGMTLAAFGGITALTNGVKVEVENIGEPIREWFTFKTNSELLARARDGGQLVIDAYTGGEDLVHADFSLDPGIPLRPGSSDKIRFSIQDDLSDLVNFDVLAEGYLS